MGCAGLRKTINPKCENNAACKWVVSVGCRNKSKTSKTKSKTTKKKKTISPEDIENLMNAAATGNNEKIKSLLNEGVNVNAADPRDGETALMVASTSKHVDTVKLLLKKGANINRKAPSTGETALRYATSHNQADIVKVLLKNGAKPNIKDAIGETPLMLAAQNAGPDGTQIVKLLLNAGASKTLKSNSGETALSLTLDEKAARIRDGGAPNYHDEVIKLLSSPRNCSKFRKTVDPKCNNQPNCKWVVGSGCKKK